MVSQSRWQQRSRKEERHHVDGVGIDCDVGYDIHDRLFDLVSKVAVGIGDVESGDVREDRRRDR